PAGQPGGFWTVEYYAQYFNVDTNDVLQRMLGTLLPNISFTDLIGTNPDLYGPFWIATTVIFSIFIASSVAGSLNALLRNGTYTPDMTILSVAVTTVYVFVTALPLAVWGVLRYYKGPASLLQMIDAWGYALTVWIPVSLLCIIPFDIVRWVLVVLAFASSFFFKIRTLRPLVSQTSNASVAQTTILGILLVTDLGLALLFKFYFYTFDVTSPGSGAGAGKGTTNATSFEVGVRGLSVGLGGSE
ncbi:uncharacterized protein EV422DRAFT_501810, partial [Fimicolochytrium jonesii]|uniref:uncharacterized protein n=1 Tax=Fimicolochytrium jonesii TaxID=1396493 RepID=UPI0022FE174A